MIYLATWYEVFKVGSFIRCFFFWLPRCVEKARIWGYLIVGTSGSIPRSWAFYNTAWKSEKENIGWKEPTLKTSYQSPNISSYARRSRIKVPWMTALDRICFGPIYTGNPGDLKLVYERRLICSYRPCVASNWMLRKIYEPFVIGVRHAKDANILRVYAIEKYAEYDTHRSPRVGCGWRFVLPTTDIIVPPLISLVVNHANNLKLISCLACSHAASNLFLQSGHASH